MSPSSTVVIYRPAGSGQKDRQARFDLTLIPDPRAWLDARLGPLAHFEMLGVETSEVGPASPASTSDLRIRLSALGARLDAAIQQRIAADRARLATLSARLDAAKPIPAAA